MGSNDDFRDGTDASRTGLAASAISGTIQATAALISSVSRESATLVRKAENTSGLVS